MLDFNQTSVVMSNMWGEKNKTTTTLLFFVCIARIQTCLYNCSCSVRYTPIQSAGNADMLKVWCDVTLRSLAEVGYSSKVIRIEIGTYIQWVTAQQTMACMHGMGQDWIAFSFYVRYNRVMIQLKLFQRYSLNFDECVKRLSVGTFLTKLLVINSYNLWFTNTQQDSHGTLCVSS